MPHEEISPGRLRRDYMLSPITALAFFASGDKQYLLAGEDTDIKVYDVATSQLCGRLRVFRAQPIHGIAVPPAATAYDGVSSYRRDLLQVLVWGGHAVKVLPGRIISDLITANAGDGGEGSWDGIDEDRGLRNAALAAPEAVAPDWIFDGRISPFDDGRIVLLTAHNEVIQGHVATDYKGLVLGRMQSPSRPILYSGNFSWGERDCVLVAAGTVFGEILIWKCHLDSSYNDSDYSHGITVRNDVSERGETPGCEVLFVFSGHEGSIFGVHISPEIHTSSGKTIRLLASCSDDRTIRIWDITERHDEAMNENKYRTQISDARQTGYGDSIVGSLGLANSPQKCVAMAMGHVSRIWQVEIQSQGLRSTEDVIEVYSFGEDATMQKWHLELNDPGIRSGASKIGAPTNSGQRAANLVHQEIFSNHSGKQIWSHAVTDNTDGVLIATGGGDGKIALSLQTKSSGNMTDNCLTYPQSSQELDISPAYLIESCQHQNASMAPAVSSFKHGNGREMFQSFAFVTDEKLLITTRSGHLFLGRFGKKTEWEELSVPDTIRQTIQSYTILRSSGEASVAFVGTTNGELFCYSGSNREALQPFFKAHRKITDIFCLSDVGSSPIEKNCDSGGESDNIEILVTVFGTPTAELLWLGRDRSLIRQTQIIVPNGFITTTAAWCHNYLILGSRHGSISMFEQTPNGGCSLVLTIKITVGDKITSIIPLPRRSEQSPHRFLTTARDGKYRIHEILNATKNVRLTLLHETTPPFGPMVEGSWLHTNSDATQDLMLCGFRGKDMVVWNVTRQQEVATIDCGGGHRVFDYMPIKGKAEGFRFAFTKASRMKVFSQLQAPHTPLKLGGHGREIKAVSASGRYVATGAEDTMIRIWELSNRKREDLRCILGLEKHNTGIQKLKWYKDQYLFSSGGNEEFFVWEVTALESDICPLGVVCEAVFPDRSEVGDLRITDFDVHCLSEDSNYDEKKVTGTENGVIDATKRLRDPQFCISMTLSNSTIQSYIYSSQHGFRLVGRRMYTGACLTQLRHLNFGGNGYPHILAAATDGHLAIFTDTLSLKTHSEDSAGILVTKLHQSTIKSLDMHRIDLETGPSYLVVTGGDDDAIGIVHLHLAPSTSLTTDSGPTQAASASPANPTSASASVPLQSAELSIGPHQTPLEPFGQSQSQGRSLYEIQNKCIIRSAHAAAVTGLGIVRLEAGGRDVIIVSTSNDQRVKTWRLVDWRSNSLKVHLLDDQYSGVADAGDLEVMRDEDGDADRSRVLVAGVGVEIWGVGNRTA
ncbi:WD40 repeat-like protein [Xylariaceae sp. FL1651]|nr:WD40 repeat-like protein [Xylariaceae sp. FL1651]